MENVSLKIKNGFTLAEVLITLVIIGVIAALTIPTAINNIQEQEFKSQFAKAFSLVSNSVYKTEMNDFFGYAKCYYSSDGNQSEDCKKFFYAAFSKNLSTQKICTTNSLADGCIPRYKTYCTSGACSGYSQSNIENVNPAFVLTNGQIIIPYNPNTWSMPLFLVDINGQKGPNASGKDLFGFMLRRNDDNVLYLYPHTIINPVEGGRTTEEMIQFALAGKK